MDDQCEFRVIFPWNVTLLPPSSPSFGTRIDLVAIFTSCFAMHSSTLTQFTNDLFVPHIRWIVWYDITTTEQSLTWLVKSCPHKTVHDQTVSFQQEFPSTHKGMMPYLFVAHGGRRNQTLTLNFNSSLLNSFLLPVRESICTVSAYLLRQIVVI